MLGVLGLNLGLAPGGSWRPVGLRVVASFDFCERQIISFLTLQPHQKRAYERSDIGSTQGYVSVWCALRSLFRRVLAGMPPID